jgi:hypothetical protein
MHQKAVAVHVLDMHPGMDMPTDPCGKRSPCFGGGCCVAAAVQSVTQIVLRLTSPLVSPSVVSGVDILVSAELRPPISNA